MTSSTLTGAEILQVTGVTGTGLPSGQTLQTTTLNLAQIEGFGAVATAGGLSLTTSATFTQVPGLTVNVIAGATYLFEIYLSIASSAGGGIAVNLGKGTTTAATFTADTWIYNTTTTSAQGATTVLTTNLATYTGIATAVEVNGSFTATATGTFAVFAAQNVGGNASTTTVNAGSYISMQRIS